MLRSISCSLCSFALISTMEESSLKAGCGREGPTTMNWSMRGSFFDISVLLLRVEKTGAQHAMTYAFETHILEC